LSVPVQVDELRRADYVDVGGTRSKAKRLHCAGAVAAFPVAGEGLQGERGWITVDKQVLNSVAIQIPYQFAPNRQRRVRCSEGLRKGSGRIAVRRQRNRGTTKGRTTVQKRD